MAVKRSRGFTLLEVMIVCVIVGILAAIVLPSYQNQVRKANRSAAQQFIMDVATKEQQILLDSRNYIAIADGNFGNSPSDATTPGVGIAQPDTTSGKYTYAVAVDNTATPPTFTITATAVNGQAVDGNLTVNQSGTKTGNW
jgi:type IV pilus assembly protein PilE